MKPVPLHTAAARIREACRRRPSPFFFVCGAGISVPSVPLAWAIEQECRVRAQELGLAIGTPPSDPAGSYSYWLEQAWPDADQRRAYFREKIEGRPLTDAVLRLAHLLCGDGPSQLLVTPNFDDFVSRALHLFGHPHVVCDHPATTARVDLGATDAQILHVHGTYWFYDLVNTDAEIAERATGMRAGPGMSEILDDVLRSRSPLVVGYSGWEGDVIMRALRTRLKKGLRHQLYWFAFTPRAIESLPKWLREHPNVSFVLPEEGETQPADRVFDALLRAFQVDAPALTRDPLGFFAERLAATAPERAPGAPPDLYYFEDVVRRVREATEMSVVRSAVAEIEKVRDAVRRGRYELAARYAKGISLEGLPRGRVLELEGALWPAVARGGADPAEDLRILEVYLKLALARPGLGVRSGRIASALIGRASALLRQGHHRKAGIAARDALGRLSAARMPRAILRLSVLEARALAQGDRLDAALALLDSLPDRFQKTRDLRLRAELVGARRERAVLLIAGDREGEARATLDALVRDLERARSAPFQRELGRALNLRATLTPGSTADLERAGELLGDVPRADRAARRSELDRAE